MPGPARLITGEIHRPSGNPGYDDGFQSTGIDRCETSDEKIEGGGEEGLLSHHCGGNWNVRV